MLGAALGLFEELVTDRDMSWFSHVLASVSGELYSGSNECPTGHCSTKSCGHVNTSGSPEPKLGHCTDRPCGWSLG